MKKTLIIGMVLGLMVGSVTFYYGFKYGEKASENLIKDSAYIKNQEVKIVGGRYSPKE